MTDFLPHPVLTELGDAQENFDAIDGHVLLLANQLDDVTPATGRTNLGLLCGTVTVVFTAAALSNAVNIVHNLGRVPLSMTATILGGDPGVTITPFMKSNASITTATIQARTTAVSTMNVVYSWWVVG